MTQGNVNYAALVATAPPTWVFKQDRRSRVWQLNGPHGPLVAKRYLAPPPAQAAQALLGRHPGQVEAAATARLAAMNLPVVPILGHGPAWNLLGCTYWLVMPYIGKAVHQLHHEGDLEDPRRRKHVIDQIALVTIELVQRALCKPDHRASDLLLDDRGRLWMVDPGQVRPAKKRHHTVHMLAVLLRSLAALDIPSGERLYCLNLIRTRCEFLGPTRALAQEVDAAKLD